MPRVQKLSDRGVRVLGQIRDFQGKALPKVTVEVSLPVPCSWQGKILSVRQQVETDGDGRFEFWLPPTSGLQPLDGSKDTPAYFIKCPGISAAWHFQVPDGITTMQLGTKDKKGGKHVVSE